MVVGDGTVEGPGGGGVEPLDEDDPTRLGPYELLGRLGQGGMGTVFLGRRADPDGADDGETAAGAAAPDRADPRGSGRERLVAVKVIRPDLAREPEFRERFGQEATAARRVARFCTAEVLDVDVASRRPYLVTEYIEGRTLAAAVREDGPLPGVEVERLAVAVASALTAIHAAGLVHRDLKPGNIMLSPSGARVIDFGIARAMDATTTFTHAGVGTPAFMAPEQALGGVVAPPADIYAWGGVVLYAATGRLPHGDGPSPVVLYRAVNEEPDLTGLDPGLRELVARAMAKDPATRPTAQGLLLLLVGATQLDDEENKEDDEEDAPLEPEEPVEPVAATARPDAAPLPPSQRPSSANPSAGAIFPAAPSPRRVARSAMEEALALAADIARDIDAGRAALARPRPASVSPAGPGTHAAGEETTARALPTDPRGRAAPARPAATTDPPTREATTFVPPHLAGGTRPPDDAHRLDDGRPVDGGADPAGRRRPTRRFGVRRAGLVGLGPAVDAVPLGEPLAGHTGQVTSVAFAPDGRMLATASVDGTARVWRLAGETDTGASPLGEPLRGHEGRVLAVAYSPDGRALATAGGDHTARLWLRAATGSEARPAVDGHGYHPLGIAHGHSDQVTSVAFARGGRLLATGGLDGTARLWQLDLDGASRDAVRPLGRPLAGHQGKVLAVAFSPDGQILATAGTDHTARLWDLTSSVPRPLGPPLADHRWHVRALAVSPDGVTLAVAAGFGAVRLWDLTDPAHPSSLAELASRQSGQVRAVAFAADGRTLAAAVGIGAAVSLWNVEDPASPEPLGQLSTGHVGTVRALAFSPTDDILATAGDTSARLWRPAE
ncbi:MULTISPECIES: WD40 repeat domain-containing serine/threonine protein kinase [Pseudofrankia]|uniref:WD40 repeat domain-containing serine/threonine protein kinase n=1 Tax=Pseudofrankia TaxID=2994363 RepID=UPI000234B274|nr:MULTISPECIES: serine/threonine-protein kinase [Pseudofrankia]OHV39566.1 serine/threonine protein kinase [Pseudofrankia sp. EUN1h]